MLNSPIRRQSTMINEAHYNRLGGGNQSLNPDLPLGVEVLLVLGLRAREVCAAFLWPRNGLPILPTTSRSPHCFNCRLAAETCRHGQHRTAMGISYVWPGLRFRRAEVRGASPEEVQKSSEVYLLVAGSDANVKFRDNLLDIKQLECVNHDGLEQWRPVLKEPFPIQAESIAAVRAALGLPPGPMIGDAASFDALVAGLHSAAPACAALREQGADSVSHPGLLRRAHQSQRAEGKLVRTAAIEDADATRVIEAVRAMGLDHFPNTSYPRGLKQLLGMSL